MRGSLYAAGLASGLECVVSGVRAEADDTPVPLRRASAGWSRCRSGKVMMDGRLREWSNAFCTPVQYNHRDVENRAAQFFYMWDDEAFYIGLRCLDKKQANPAALDADLRRRRGRVLPRYAPGRRPARQGLDDGRDPLLLLGVPGQGRQAAVGDAAGDRDEQDRSRRGWRSGRRATTTAMRSSSSFPGRTSPSFTPKPGAVLALDAELCSGDGGKRTDRTLRLRLAALGAAARLARQGRAGPGVRPRLLPGRRPGARSRSGSRRPGSSPSARRSRRSSPSPRPSPRSSARSRSGSTTPTARSSRRSRARIEPFGPQRPGLPPRRRALVDRRLSPPTPISRRPGVIARTDKTLTTVAPRMVDEAIISGR